MPTSKRRKPSSLPTSAASQSCELQQSKSQFREETVLLPLLLHAANLTGSRTFVEIGAFDGITYSNTLAIERCHGWRGLLIEGNPANFARLNASGRSAVKMHSAVCDEVAGGFVQFSRRGGENAGMTESMSPSLLRKVKAKLGFHTAKVPCARFQALLAVNGWRNATFL